MRISENAPSTGCPDLELLAAFVEGRLEPAERTRMIEHLADCDACREIVAESRALVLEVGADGATGGAPPAALARNPGWRKVRWVAAAAALVAAVGVAVWMARGSASIDSTIAQFIDAGAHRGLPAEWSDPVWPVLRGGGLVAVDRSVAFRLGVRSVDLEISWARAELEAVRQLALESASLVRRLPFTESIAATLEDLGSRAAAGRLDEPAFRAALAVMTTELPLAAGPDEFALGRWAEGARLSAMADATSWPAPAPPVAKDWAGVAELVAEANRNRADPSAWRVAIDRLIAHAGASS